MLVDCFLFYNELDLLEYRLNLLHKIVDYFVIVESMNTFVGEKKELYYKKNQDKFKQFDKQIIHIIVDDMPLKEKLNTNNTIWTNEHHQRNCIKRGLDKLPLKDDDIVMIGDVDEIPDPTFITNIIPDINSIHAILMDLYWYNLNRKKKGPVSWNSYKIGKYQYLKNMSIQKIRNINVPNIRNTRGGWHLSYFGDIHFIHNKLNNFAHQEKEVQDINTLPEIQKRMNNGGDLYSINRGWKFMYIPIKDNDYLPPQYELFLSNYY